MRIDQFSTPPQRLVLAIASVMTVSPRCSPSAVSTAPASPTATVPKHSPRSSSCSEQNRALVVTAASERGTRTARPRRAAAGGAAVVITTVIAASAASAKDERGRTGRVYPRRMAAPGLTYRISVPRPHDHLAQVTLEVPTAGRGAPLVVAMPAWCPGSYLIRDYARFVRDLVAHDPDGRPRPITKLDKATWAIDVGDAPAITLGYAVFGHELSVRTNHIDDGHAFLHGPATFLYPVDGRALPCAVEVEGPPGRGWAIATPLAGGDAAPGDRYHLTAPSIDALFDAPIHLGHDRLETFTVGATRFELALWGPHHAGAFTVAQLVADLGAIAADHARRVTGDPAAFPFARYTFLLMLAADGYGGLEHAAGSANLYHPAAFTTRKHYEGLLELLSHELFHAWNGKRIAGGAARRRLPARGLHPLPVGDGGRDQPLRSVALRSAGRITARSLLEKVLDDWARLQATPGRARHSLEASSFDAWIKLYRPDESNLNTTVSYYLKGGLAALALDLEIRRRSEDARGLDDVLRWLWQRYGAPGVPHPEDVLPDFAEATGLDLGDTFARVIRGVEDPPLVAELAAVGLALRQVGEPGSDGAPPAWLGVTVGGLRVTGVLDGAPAAAAGLAVGDELLAIDGWRIGSDNDARALLAAAGVGATVEVALFRRGRLVQLRAEVGAGPPPRSSCRPASTRRRGGGALPALARRAVPPGETLASITIATRAV
jgi:predicted metalloprotease with PDZ domain